MELKSMINKLRTGANMSQEQFAAKFGVSRQSVQKWENGGSIPELSKIIKISKYFGVSLDALILGNDNRIVEEMKSTNQIKPQYANIHDWDFYSSNLIILHFLVFLLHLPFRALEPLLVVAIGRPAEHIELVECSEGDNLNYYRKEGVHYVPKIGVDELILK
mgnify:CR=1 FL=1